MKNPLRRICASSLAAFAFTPLVLSTPARAVDIYWGGDVNSIFNTDGNWFVDLAQLSPFAGVPGANDVAIFNASGLIENQVASLGGPVTVSGLVFNASATTGITITDTNTLTLGSAGITLASGTGAHAIAAPTTLAETQTWQNDSGNVFTHSGNVLLVGHLTLAGTGGFTFNTGTFTVGNANREITVTTPGPVHFGNISVNDGVPRLLIFDVAGGSVVDADGVIAGNGAVRKDGTGTLNLNAANTFSSTGSGLYITDGRVNVNVSNAASPRLNLGTFTDGSVVGGTPVLHLAAGVDYRVENIYYRTFGTNPGAAIIQGEGNIVLLGNRVIDVSDSTATDAELTINVPIRNQTNGGGTARSLVKDGEGTLILNGANDFTGTFTISGGTVIQNTTQAVGSPLTFDAASTLTVGSGANFLLAGTVTSTTAASGSVINGPGGLQLAAGTVTRIFNIADGSAANDLTISTALVQGSGTSNVQKNGMGRLVLQGVHTYTGTTEVAQGELVLDYSVNNGDNKLSNTANLQLRGGTLTLNGNSTAATLEDTGTGDLRVVSGTSIVSLISNNGQTVTLDMDDIIRNTGEGLVDFRTNNASLTTFQTTATNDASGMIGVWATFNSDRFATVDGSGRITAFDEDVLQSDRSLWQPRDHIIVDGPLTGALGASRLASLIFDAPVANTLTLDNPSGALTLDARGILVSADVGANNTTIVGGQIVIPMGTGTATTPVGLVITNYSAGTLEIAANLGGNDSPLGRLQEVTIGGTGEVLLSGRNMLSGDTNIHGNVRVTGNALADYKNVVFATGGSGIVLNLAGATEGIGNLSGGSITGGQTDARIDLGGGTLILNQMSSSTFSGDIVGTGTVIKRGAGSFRSSTDLNFDGQLQILGDVMHFDDQNVHSLAGAVDILVRGGQMLGQQNQAGSLNKFGNGTLTLESTAGSGVRITSNQSTTSPTGGSRTETMSRLNLNAGANTISLFNQGTANALVTVLAFDNAATAFSRDNNATLFVQGDNLGALGAVRDSSRLTFANSIADLLIGGGGPAGAKDISILPFVVGENTNTGGVGNTFVTVGANGLRTLDIATEYQTNYATAIAAADENFSTAASLAGLASGTLNSLRLDASGASLTIEGGAGNTLNLASGALLLTAGANVNDATISGFGQIRAGSAAAENDELVLFVTSSNAAPADAVLTISSQIADQAAGGGATSLTKSGNGTLVLTGANTYSGETTVNQGVLEFGSLGSLGTGSLVRAAGGTLRWGAANTADISARTVELLGASVYLTPAGTSGNNGGNILDAGAVFDIGANNVTLANAIGNGGTGGLTKIGSGTLTLSAAPTYTGATVIAEGAMNFATIAPNTTSALYILSEAGAVTSTVTSGLNVNQLIVGGSYEGTLSSSGELTVNGGAVNIGSGRGDDFLLIGWRDSNAPTAANGAHFLGVADFESATGVNIDVAQLTLGHFASGVANNTSTATGQLLLPTASSAVNTITANSVIVGNAPGGVFNSNRTSTLHLGAGATTMNADTLILGGRKSEGELVIDAGGSFTLRGTQGGETGANVFLGENDNATGSTSTPAIGLLDLTGAEADLKIHNLYLGRLSYSSAGGSGTGTLVFDTGTVQATNVRMGFNNFNPVGSVGPTSFATGTIFQGGGTFRFEEMSKGTTAGSSGSYVWNAGTMANIAGRDLRNENVVVSMDTSEERFFTVSAGNRATFAEAAGFTGGGGFTKNGAGTLTLAGTNDYFGETYIDEGALLVNGSITGSIITARDGGTIGGNGAIATPVLTESGATVAPGDGIGILETGDFSLALGATFDLTLGGTSAGEGAGFHDRLVVNGAVTLDGDARIALSLAGGYDPVVGDTFYVILNDGTADPIVGTGFTNAPGSILTGIDGSQFLVSYTAEFGIGFADVGNDVALELLAVPEPTSLVSLLGGLGMLGLRRFRRKIA